MTKILEVLSGSDKWIKGSGARTADGGLCKPDDSNAVCWCLLGGLEKAYGNINGEAKMEYEKLRETVKRLFPLRLGAWINDPQLSTFNDHRDTTFEDIITVIKEASL